jgi:serine protease Do
MPSHPCQEPATPKHRSPRRWALMTSVTGLGAALLITGAAGGLHLDRLDLIAPAYAAESAGPPGFADIVQKVKPAVISVRVRLDAAPQISGSNAPRMAQGSGFFISANGYAVTNNHVVDHATAVEITTNEGKSYRAEVVGTDAKTDVALLKVEGHADFPYVTFSNAPTRVGDWVLVVGNPFGLGGTVTAGIISARGRDIGSGPYDDFIQIDAPVNKGNSGGPAFDQSGNVVGVTTAIYSPSGGSVGIGFAIPADTVKSVVAQLKNKGRVTRGWIGVQVQKVTPDIAGSLGLKQAEGALVAALQSSAPAARAGIVSGDVITSVNGQAIKDSRELARRVASLQPGETARLGLVHEGSQKTVSVTLGAMPNEQ